MDTTTYTSAYIEDAIRILQGLDRSAIDRMVRILANVRETGGRLFILGVGGGAGNAGHAVNDFRKIVGIESYAPTDNVSELTARINDEGWDSSFRNWLEGSRIGPQDAVLVFSVGGGNAEKKVSINIVEALKLAKGVGARILGVVGRDGGFTAQVGDAVVIVPTVDAATVTPHTEAFQAVVWHLVVSHPDLKRNEMAWEAKR
ncbi:SIS domain-containing protein [Azospirillum rugosum]|uniref:D-sedoheptulose 7-phosphate isomerase n=1 Tax=Azospirillum rugosum TaxID=416170 RepID=A0ABS4SNZ4_9PROT|nr:SIS domain-containing protein [Azospirillum rugosum]MBP2294284.1 D-sedoheptulose 7-phosphate isomerase [Azospirillum rugosum]MDQ0527619.1 D-sedoheptulose 7-phosphate isomerase [Azospirillum rugosum]